MKRDVSFESLVEDLRLDEVISWIYTVNFPKSVFGKDSSLNLVGQNILMLTIQSHRLKNFDLSSNEN